MLQLVNVGHKALADYATIATRGLMDEIRRLAEPLQGKRVVHLSATAFGGGVAEINYTLVPLMQSAGLETEWRIIRGADEFFNVTKTIHNALQGNPQGLSPEQQDIFRRYNEANATEFEPETLILLLNALARSGSCAVTSTSRHPTGRCSTSSCRRSGSTALRSSTAASTCPTTPS